MNNTNSIYEGNIMSTTDGKMKALQFYVRSLIKDETKQMKDENKQMNQTWGICELQSLESDH